MYLIQQLINALTVGGVYALVAVGFAVIYNILSFSNWSYGATIMLSSYVGYYVTSRLGFSFLPALLTDMVAGGIVAVVIEFLALRPIRLRRGLLIYLFVTSISASTAAQCVVLATIGGRYQIWPEIVSSAAVRIGSLTISRMNILMGGACVFALLVLNLVLFRTRIGMAIRAIACDLEAAALMGININRVISFVFFMSGTMGGLAGTLLGMAYTTYPQMGSEAMVMGFVAAILGGLGSITGSLIGGIVLAIVETIVIITPLGSSASPVVTFLILLLIPFIRPSGIVGKSTEEKA